MSMLVIRDLHVEVDGKQVLKGLDLTVEAGQVHAIMGPNGSGKSTLAYAIAGHPGYEITDGEILVDGEDVTEAGADERAQKGLFLAFQYPHAIPGVTVTPGIAWGYWNARKRPFWARSSAPSSETSTPSSRISPSVTT